ncbi:RabGAP/TBC [Atractiella rhizophila]|nr:RabGAP/TBC [Atractiella rhizophila]
MGGGKMDSDSENDYLKVDGRPSNECSQTTGFPSNQSSSSTPPSLARRGTKGRSISPSDSPLLSKTYEHINLVEGEGAGGPGETSGKVKRSESENVPKETCKLLYAKSAVFVHPTSYLKDNVEGWLAIVQRGDAKEGTTESILLSWIPSSLLSQSSDHKTYVSVDLSQSGTLSTSETIDSNSILVSLPPSSSPNSPAFSLPLSQVYSIQLRPPTLSSWFASCNIYSYPPSPSATSSQRELPTLYFHDDRPASTTTANTPGGTKDSRIPISSSGPSSSSPFAKPHSPISEFLAHLRPHCTSLLRSALDSSLYLVNPSRADVEVHSVPVFEDDAIDLPVPGTSAGAGTVRRRKGKSLSILHESLGQGRRRNGGEESGTETEGEGEGGIRSPSMGQLTFGVLSGFSKITKNARSAAQSAAQQVLSHPLAQPVLRHIPPPILAATHAKPELYSRWTETAGVGGYDSAKVYLAKWARVVAEEGERARRAEVEVRGGGEGEEEEVGSWEVLVSTYKLTPHHSSRASNTPISLTEYTRSLSDSTTHTLLLSGPEIRKRIFQRGLNAEDGVRKEVWPALLGVWEWEWSGEKRAEELAKKREEYARLKKVWRGDSEAAREVRKSQRFEEESHRIEIDCRRTDRTQPMFLADDDAKEEEELSKEYGGNDGEDKEYWSESVSDAHPTSNFHVRKMQEILMTYNYYEDELGYVQGMSDLLSPIYVVVEGDEALAFWCFVGLMQRAKPNFLRDQSGMKKQLTLLQSLIALMDPQLYRFLERVGALNLFFVFRWMLCLFKREFEWLQVQRIWEVCWTDHYSKQFHIFFALAIIESQRDVIMRYLTEFDEILKYCNELAMTMDPEPLLARAEVLFLTFRSIIETYDRRRGEEKDVGTSPMSTSQTLRRRAGSAPEPIVKSESGRRDSLKSKLPPFDEALRELLE